MASGLVLVSGAWTLQYTTPIPNGFIKDTYGSGGDGIMIVITNTPSSSLGVTQSNAGSVSTTVTGTDTTDSVGNSGPICIISFGGN